MSIPLYISVVAILIVFSSFFSGTEIAYTSVRSQRIYDRYEKNKTAPVRLAVYFLSHFDNMLAAILIGNNIANLTASSLATVVVVELLGEKFSWVATVVMTILVLIFGEILPKTIGKAHSELVCTASSLPLYGLSFILYPIITFVNRVMDKISHLWEKFKATEDVISEGELSSVMDIVEDEGVIDREHATLVRRAIDYKNIRAYEIITPRIDIEYIDINDQGSDIISQVLGSGYTRLPVCDGDADNILGVLHLNKLLFRIESGDITSDSDVVSYIRSLMSPPIFIPKTSPLHRTVEIMREMQQQLVFVVDSYGGVMGILTMEDALEVIVGDIWDESDEIEPDIVKISDTEYDLSSKLRLRELFDEVELDCDTSPIEGKYTVLGGWCADILGLSPDIGDSFTWASLTFTVRTLRDKVTDRLTLTISDSAGCDQFVS